MDLVDLRRGGRSRASSPSCASFLAPLAVHDIAAIPISALDGDNVVDRSERDALVRRPDALGAPRDRRGRGRPPRRCRRAVPGPVGHPSRCGHLTGRRVRRSHRRRRRAPSTPITAATPDSWPAACCTPATTSSCSPGANRPASPQSTPSTGSSTRRAAPLSVTVRLEDDLDVSRGDLICSADQAPIVTRELEATICWMSERPLRAGDRLSIKHTTRTAQAIVVALDERVNVDTLEAEPTLRRSGSTTSARCACGPRAR